MYIIRLIDFLYADNAIILAESGSQLQLAINVLKAYCDTCNLPVNLNKTNINVFSKDKICNWPSLFYGDLQVAVIRNILGCGFQSQWKI